MRNTVHAQTLQLSISETVMNNPVLMFFKMTFNDTSDSVMYTSSGRLLSSNKEEIHRIKEELQTEVADFRAQCEHQQRRALEEAQEKKRWATEEKAQADMVKIISKVFTLILLYQD